MSESPIDYLRRTPEEHPELYEKESVEVVASG
jgi:hypothetical protein